jgi:hypothetical protein
VVEYDDHEPVDRRLSQTSRRLFAFDRGWMIDPDSENDVMGGLDTTLLPGREAVFKIAYSVTNPADIVLEVSPDFEHENVIYTP